MFIQLKRIVYLLSLSIIVLLHGCGDGSSGGGGSSGGSAPTATTTAATDVGTTTVTLNGTVNPNGLSTTAVFQWGTTTSYGNTTTTQSLGSGTSAVSVTQALTGLTAGTTYHYRIEATNSSGTTNASDMTFTTNSFAPAESPHKAAYYRYATPPPGFTAVVGWMQAIDIQGTGIPDKVEVDWMRVHATVNGVDTVILEDTFDSHTSAMDWYGLYNRNPWFAGDRLAAMPFTIQNSNLILEPSLNPDRVSHWWNTSRSLIPADTSRVWFEARVRITGGAGVQAGIDYWKDLAASYAGPDVNNTEAGASDWYGNSTADWQIITVGHP